ncbi:MULTISPECIES: GlsB/YeaQ/YmgE family stress response membrane protein [Actinosynnema]|uniref:GlsB/YeaQ/YmgE family stress response membrane protein n=1 Tax=Actinosynnema TaxID=40566 RepID=UPI003555E1EB
MSTASRNAGFGALQGEGCVMEITGIISTLLIGAVVGGLGRLVVPGKQRMSLLTTVLVGIGAALLGTVGATVLGVADTAGVDWIELALQVGLAGAGVTFLSDRSRAHQYH